MKTCNSCVYHYSDRSGAVCNALHAIASVDQAEQCQDYERGASKPVASRDRLPINQDTLTIFQFKRRYQDRPYENLPFAIATRGQYGLLSSGARIVSLDVNLHNQPIKSGMLDSGFDLRSGINSGWTLFVTIK